MNEKQKGINSVENDSSKIKKKKIYTMPSRFYVEDNSAGGKKNNFLIIAIIILFLAISGGVVFYFLQKKGDSVSSTVVNDNINNNNNVNNVNLNSNSNININTNNTNAVVNKNINAKNINLNIFNDNVNTNTSASLNVNSTVGSSIDTDKDGLTDIEEVLFGTSVNLPDTDKDSYADGQEVIDGYDPNGEGKLENSKKVRFYNDVENGYSLLYPSAWVVDNDPITSGGKMFTSGEEFVVVSIQDNPANLSARDWYLTKSPGINSSLIKTVSNWNKELSGVLSLDGLNVYYTKNSKVYVLSYNINILSEASYSTVFQMMYKSFNVTKPVVKNINTNVNTNSTVNANINTNTDVNSNTNINNNNNTNSEPRL